MKWICIALALALAPAMAQDAPDADTLIERLGDPDFSVREQATEALIALGEGAVPALEKALNSDDPEVSWRAQQALDGIHAAQEEEETPEGGSGLQVLPLVPGEGMEDLEKLLGEGFGRDLGKMFEDMLGGGGGGGRGFTFQFGSGNGLSQGGNFGDVWVSTTGVSELLRNQLDLEEGVGVALGKDCKNIERFGVKAFDIVLSVDGRAVSEFADLGSLFLLPEGTETSVEVLRKGRVQTLTLTVGGPEAPKKDDTRERDF